MSCSCGRQERPSRSNPNTRHARLECRPDRQHSISVSPRSPSMSGAIPSSRRISNYPGCRGGGWHLGPGASSAVWPGARCCRSQDATCSTSATFPLESHYSTRQLLPSLGDGGRARRSVWLVRASPRWQQEQGKSRSPARMRAPLAPPAVDIRHTTYASLRIDVEIQAFVRARTGHHGSRPAYMQQVGTLAMVTEEPQGVQPPPRVDALVRWSIR